MSFQIRPLDKHLFEPLFHLSDQELAVHAAVRVTAVSGTGYPCRVSFVDAQPGEEVLLLNYEHHTANTPFRSSHAIYVRKDAEQAKPQVDEVPGLFRSRMLSLRAFDASGMLLAATLCPGADLAPSIHKLFHNDQHACIHLHFAAHGCFGAYIHRA